MAEEIDVEKCNFQNFRSPVTLTLTLDRVIRHTIMHHSSISIYTLNFIEIGKIFRGQTDVPTNVYFTPPLMLLGWLRRRSQPKNWHNKHIVTTNNFTAKLLYTCLTQLFNPSDLIWRSWRRFKINVIWNSHTSNMASQLWAKPTRTSKTMLLIQDIYIL